MTSHPMKSQAHASSRDKFKAITGHSGGGHAYGGSSHLKKAGKDGDVKTWSGHHKAHRKAEMRAHGGRDKARADRRARGGKEFKSETYGPPVNPSPIDTSKLKPGKGRNPQNQGSESVGEEWYKRLAGKGEKTKSGMSDQDLKGMAYGKRGGKMRRGGRALGGTNNADDWGGEDSTRQTIPVKERTSQSWKGDASNRKRWTYEPPQYEDWGMHPASGRKKYARGGKAPGKVIINVNASQPRPAPMRPPVPPPAPPPGPPPGGPPPGGAPPAPPPGMSGGPGAANPMAALNKGMGGMGFARGGKTKGQHPNPAGGPRGGDAKYDLAGWRKYAATDREKRMSGKAGMTQAYTKRIGDDGSLDVQPVKPGKRASGGRMTAGTFSGVGRLEQAAISAKDRHR